MELGRDAWGHLTSPRACWRDPSSPLPPPPPLPPVAQWRDQLPAELHRPLALKGSMWLWEAAAAQAKWRFRRGGVAAQGLGRGCFGGSCEKVSQSVGVNYCRVAESKDVQCCYRCFGLKLNGLGGRWDPGERGKRPDWLVTPPCPDHWHSDPNDWIMSHLLLKKFPFFFFHFWLKLTLNIKQHQYRSFLCSNTLSLFYFYLFFFFFIILGFCFFKTTTI